MAKTAPSKSRMTKSVTKRPTVKQSPSNVKMDKQKSTRPVVAKAKGPTVPISSPKEVSHKPTNPQKPAVMDKIAQDIAKKYGINDTVMEARNDAGRGIQGSPLPEKKMGTNVRTGVNDYQNRPNAKPPTTSKSDANKKAWLTRKKLYGSSGQKGK